MSNLNWIDYIILLIFFFSIIAGFIRGFVKEVVSLITLVAAFVIATMFSNALAQLFTSHPSVQNAVNQATTSLGVDTAQPVSYIALGISFALLFAGTIIVGMIVSFFLNFAFKSGVLGIGNRLLGGIFGLVRGYIINLALIFVVQLTPLGTQASWSQSQFVNMYQPAVQWLGNIVSPSLANLKARFEQTIQNFGSQLQNNYGGYVR